MSAADFYTGIVAEAYGPLRGDVVEAGPYLDFVRAEGEPALELGCGDVGPFLELVAAGSTSRASTRRPTWCGAAARRPPRRG